MSSEPAIRDPELRAELVRYSTKNAYIATQFADAICTCGGTQFGLQLDDDQGAAVRTCVACKQEHAIGDSDEYLDDADLEECACSCGAEVFEVTAGVALYAESEDVKWIYLACRCVTCRLAAVYGDWKNEFSGYRELLARI